MADLTIDEMIEYYQNIGSDEILEEPEGYALELVNVSEMMRARIRSGKRSDGKQIGKYSKYWANHPYKNRRVNKYRNWAKEREKVGLQTAYVDLDFTGGLLESLMVVWDGDDIQAVFKTNEDAIVAKELEALYRKGGAPIFAFSAQELKAITEWVSNYTLGLYNQGKLF